MNCSENSNRCNCVSEILERILGLQRQNFDNESFTGCDKPFLGPVCNTVCYNTRPIMLFNCCTGNAWSFPYTNPVTNVEATSDVFRVEAVDDCCCTCRILYLDEATNAYVSTNEFFTIDLNCVGAIKCLADTFVDLC